MSQAPTTTTPPAEGAPAAAGGKRKLVILIVLLNVLALGGVAAYVVLQGRKGAAHAAPAAAAEGEGGGEGEGAAAAEGGEGGEGGEGEHAGGTKATHSRGPLIALDAIITNIVDLDELRFLKVTVQLQAKDEAAKAAIEDALVPVRDRILLRLSSLTVDDTHGAEKKIALQTELLRLVNTELGGGNKVTHVYFTEFVVQ